MKLYFKNLLHQLSTYIIIVVILLSRLAQRTPFKENVYPQFIEHYFQFFSNNYMSLFVPLTFCFWCFGSLTILQDEHIILRHKSRFQLFLTCVKYGCADALTFTVLMFITAMPILLCQFIPTFNNLLFYGLCFLLQFLFFTICSLLFLILFLAFSKSYVSFAVVVCYGALDFVASYGRVSGWHNISAQLMLTTGFKAAIVNMRLLLAMVIVLVIIAYFAVSKKDFISRIEAKA